MIRRRYLSRGRELGGPPGNEAVSSPNDPGIESLADSFAAQRPRSRELYDRAHRVFAAGITHNLRWALPFPVYIDHVDGPYKWDVDGQRYLDYGMASASLFLGHRDPEVMDAIESQLRKGTGPTACTEAEVEWAELVKELIPCAERVRFTGSGTEATLLALRLARAYTGRSKIVKFEGHYHGWQDYVMVGHREPFSRPASAGVPTEVLAQTLVASLDDPIASLSRLLDRGDVAGVILEPSGASWGSSPLDPRLLATMQDLTSKSRALLIFDEVVTGFRLSAGGVQRKENVTPDLATLGKILTGGLPGGAVAGRAEILELLSPLEPSEKYVLHYGTFNANPISAAAGIATLCRLRDGKPHVTADRHGQDLRAALADIVQALGVAGFVYGEHSIFHIFLEAKENEKLRGTKVPGEITATEFLAMPASLVQRLHLELKLRGVDLLSYNGGVTSSSHMSGELEFAAVAFEGAIRSLRDSGLLATE
jgi:glutamate-1-semialdehyde 2,1-aminomutase